MPERAAAPASPALSSAWRGRPTRREWLGGASALATATLAADAGAQMGGGAQGAPDLAGVSALITGCSSGFGRLTALHLARRGATVIASMRNLNGGARPEAKDLAAIAASENLKLDIVEIDVLDDGLVRQGVAAAEETAGGALDVVVNNAGVGISGPVEAADMESAKLVVDTNLFGYMRVAQAALPAMRAKGAGLLVHVSSQLGRIVLPNLGLYCASKFGLEAMFEAMAYELAPFGVDTTIVQPGGYRTKIWDNGLRYYNAMKSRIDDERAAAYAAHLGMAERLFTGSPRTADPMDVPRAIAELIAMPAGARPLRRPVHPDTSATDAANAALAQVQSAVLGQGAYKTWHAAVTD